MTRCLDKPALYCQEVSALLRFTLKHGGPSPIWYDLSTGDFTKTTRAELERAIGQGELLCIFPELEVGERTWDRRMGKILAHSELPVIPLLLTGKTQSGSIQDTQGNNEHHHLFRRLYLLADKPINDASVNKASIERQFSYLWKKYF
ncbi:hypothetical protein ACJJJB_00465 [Microbulbifer sp. ANSA001]|uniref:hypothetical protein n=1 Tax=Microbulbifer sp. ANSA001 TaxID=3243358 RepID=UPI0040411084